ncbi:retrovirus-related Pol polyprotein from transposon 17.6 [Trichonephila clavipes]|nr:retrovirus-related Pol polyprotein from transposon 17.6 [Trichonephila clavipes]
MTECENAFRELKGKLTDKPVLYAPNFEREFIVQTDASNAEVEKHYCTTEKECASIVFAIKKLHYYLDGNPFLVMTDHNPLVWLNRNVSSNPRLLRWALALQPYNFRIVHRSGKLFPTEKFYKKGQELCNVVTPNGDRRLWWTRHSHVHLAAADIMFWHGRPCNPFFDPRGIEPRRPEDEREML